MKSLLSSFLALALVVIFSCTNPPDYPNEPTIEFVSMSKMSMQQAKVVSTNDSILLTLAFTDGDGDIGSEESADSSSNETTSEIRYIDLRQNAEQVPLKIPFVGLQGVGQGISGEIFAPIPTTTCLYEDGRFPGESAPGETNEVIYELWIVDRAGNESNRIELPAITLRCD